MGFARRLVLNSRPGWRRILYAALYVGFFGGFMLDVLLLDRLMGLVHQHTAAGQGLLVVLCAGLGGWAASRTKQAVG